jgi:hypothetical protein
MPQTSMSQTLTPGGWIALVAFAVGFLVRLVKAEKLNDWLVSLGFPAVPKKALPWVAMALGGLAMGAEALKAGLPLRDAALAAGWGLASGAFAIAGNETLSTLARRLFGDRLADFVFGKHAGPSDQPVSTSVRPPPGPSAGSGPSSLGTMVLCALLAVGTAGCGAIIGALVNVASYIQEASMVIDQIQAFVDAYFAKRPDPAKQETINDAIAKSRAALGVALKTSRGAEQLDQAQIDAAFAEFAGAYRELLTLVGPLGVRVGGSFAVSPDGALTVPPAEELVPRSAP